MSTRPTAKPALVAKNTVGAADTFIGGASNAKCHAAAPLATSRSPRAGLGGGSFAPLAGAQENKGRKHRPPGGRAP